MNFNKRNNDIYQIRNNLIDREMNFNKNYNRIYEGHKEIYKDHHLLRHAFNITNYVRIKNNEIDQKEYLEENRKERYKFNIYNYEKELKQNKTKKIYSLDDELLKILISKINKKNIEEQIKKKEEKIMFQSLSLKGIRKKNKKKNTFLNTYSTIKSFKTLDNSKDINMKKDSNISPKKYRNSLNKINNGIDNIGKTSEKYEHPTKFYFNDLQNRLKRIIQNINSEEKNNLSNFNLMKTHFQTDLNIYRKNKTISNTKMIIRPKIILKNVQKIKRKKDLENILFKESDLTYNKIKKKLYTLYKFPNKSKISID